MDHEVQLVMRRYFWSLIGLSIFSSDQTSLWSSSNEKSVELNAPVEDRNVPVLQKSLRHEFLSKTVHKSYWT